MSNNLRTLNHPFWDFVDQFDQSQHQSSADLPAYESTPDTMGGGEHHANDKEAHLYHEEEFAYPEDPADSVPEAGPSRGPHPPPPGPFDYHDGATASRSHHHRREHHHHGGVGSRGHRHGHSSGERGRGGWGGRGRGGFGGMGRPPWGQPFDMRDIASFIGDTFFGGEVPAGFPRMDRNPRNTSNDSFTPEADVFDTKNAYVVHLSLPGAKKQDIAVVWNAEQNELVISGVVLREGDEEFLNTLAMDERKIGAFERRIRLGSSGSPARVIEAGISAKLEDGVLRLNVPKQDEVASEARKIRVM